MRQLTVLMLGLGLALAAAALVTSLQPQGPRAMASARPLAAGPDEVLVVVCARDLPAGHRLASDDLYMAAVPAKSDLKDALRSIPTAVGRVLIAGGAKDGLLRSSDLARPGTGASIASQLNAEERAATVTLRDVGSKVILYPGARVDVIATMQVPAERGTRQTITRTILERRRVLAVDDEIAGAEVQVDPADGRRRPTPRSITVTLAVAPGEVERLELASEQGTIGLVLLPMTADSGAAITTGATPQSLFGLVPETPSSTTEPRSVTTPRQVEAPESREPARWEVEVVRENGVDRRSFPVEESTQERPQD